MKKMKFFSMMLITLCFVGCTKPDDDNNDNNGCGDNNGDGNQITYEYVDLGLPSGTLWATCNVGASLPEEYGDYFAWGETRPKDNYNWDNYKYCKGNDTTLTKYCCDSSFGYNGFTDILTTLEAGDDAATVNCGEDWRTPTKDEWEELIACCAQTWTTRNGVYGRLFAAPNGNSIFLPKRFDGEGLPWGLYWTSSLWLEHPRNAWNFYFDSDDYDLRPYAGWRDGGASVRPVRSSTKQ
jgi:hypothetical protein